MKACQHSFYALSLVTQACCDCANVSWALAGATETTKKKARRHHSGGPFHALRLSAALKRYAKCK
jgi:hypothetical protein